MSDTRETEYARAVVEALRPYFPDMEIPCIADATRSDVERQASVPQPTFERHLDTLADWRLHPHPNVPGRVRVSSFWVRQGRDATAVQQRADTLNALLDEIDF
jgi:hypothetical protein